ncbi:GGDEF domain-containing protein [Campylobacter sp. 19-13652]|uniref:GGDEF domain-containing protein n=1 Tax=Campylobacter sp. 19-13652 TaxID=2840180 RepID=UPI001C785E75|nr:GGDEF domain-containing protein [Campylobacter sp. 19-13652]BCX78651.1 hypothetical protein LBC_01130 [Campylobacter sp. 19-13652]
MIKIDSAQDRVVIKQSEHMDVYKFSQDVLQQLTKDNIPSIPSNYSIYFDKMLDKGPDEFKRKIADVISTIDVSPSAESSIHIEKEVRQSYIQIKSMLQAVGLIYKNLATMKVLAKKHAATLENSSDILATRKVVQNFNADLLKLMALMDKHIDIIKLNYEEISRMFKAVEEQSIYDSYYDIYNKKFLLSTMASEAESAKRYGYKSSFLLLKMSERIKGRIKNIKERENIQRLIAKMLLKTSRRSDVVAHYGEGCFAMVMRHTDIVGARKACERILGLLYEQDYLNEGEVINMEFQMVACALSGANIVEQTLSIALDRLQASDKSEAPVIIEEQI